MGRCRHPFTIKAKHPLLSTTHGLEILEIGLLHALVGSISILEAAFLKRITFKGITIFP